MPTLPALRYGLLAAAIALGAALVHGQPASTSYDVLITGGRIVDGTGGPWYRGDIAITRDRIAAMGDLSRAPATTRIDASGLVVAPGFIDMLGQSEFNVLVDNRAATRSPRA